MDPITAIGFAANILQFIEYGAKVITSAIEIYGSASGSTQETRNSQTIMTEMRLFVARLQPPENAQLSGEERALCSLATECQGLAKQISELLEKIKPKSQKLKSSSLIAGLKTKMYEGERRRLEQQLSNCRAQLHLQLSHLTSSETQARLNALVASVKDDSTKLDNMQNKLEQLRQGITPEFLTVEAQTQLQSLLRMSEQPYDVIVQHRILENLAFEGMYGRYETVDDAHIKTLGWIFNETGDDSQLEDEVGSVSSLKDDLHDYRPKDETENLPNSGENSGGGQPRDDIDCAAFEGLDDDQWNDRGESESSFEESPNKYQPKDEVNSTTSSEDEAKASARESLLNWLTSGAGIFHISGKLGSGKSTLMKYLCEHDRTKLMLEQWASPSDLVLASFFFWKPGSTLQKSLTGLIRSLLHDILKACPELIQETLPDYWTKVKSTPWQARRKLPLSDKTIRKAFFQLVSDSKLYRNHCFCFFVDGLDEYEGTNQEDAKTLVDLICSWTSLAPATVKICVSSREDNVFMNAFSQDRRIRLHDLTRSDMTSYVLDKLRHMDPEEDKATLTNLIVENAKGIFVWVALVVRRIREQIENGANLYALEREIYAFPKQLNGLFEHLLNSLTDSDLKSMYQTFSMVFQLKEYSNHDEIRLTLLSYSFLDDYIQDPMFALWQDFQLKSSNQKERAFRIESARKRLNACCRGLLELRRAKEEDTIAITHRSVPEFLSSRPQQDHMEQYLGAFNTVDAISQLTLAEMWSRDAGDITDNSNFEIAALSLVPWRTKVKLDAPPYSFLESLALAWQRHQVEGNYDSRGDLKIKFEKGVYRVVGCTDDDIVPQPRPVRLATNRSFIALQQPIYLSAYHGNYDFVKWKLEQSTVAVPDFNPLHLLLCISSSSGCTTLQSLRVTLDYLHTYGIGPQTESNLYLASFKLVTIDPGPGFDHTTTVVTLWHHVLLGCYHYDRYSNIEVLQNLGYLVEKFLEHGADPYVYMSVTNSLNWNIKLVVRIGKEREEKYFSYTYKAEGLYECEDVPLTELVERWGFENKTRILELIEKNAPMIEGIDDKQVDLILEEERSVEDSLTAFGMSDSAAGADFVMVPKELISENPEIPAVSSLKLHNLPEFAAFRSQKLLGIGTAISMGILVLCVVVALLMH